MAMGMMRNLLPDYTIVSAGLGAQEGCAADPIAIELMQMQGIDISTHRARQLETAMMAEADLILVMELEHQRYLEQQFPLVRGKTYRLCENMNSDIADPYERGPQAFADAAELISQGVHAWEKRLRAAEPGIRLVANN